MKARLLLMLIVGCASSAAANPANWSTDAGVGPSEFTLRIQFTCTGNPTICPFLDGYDSERTSTLSGSGFANVDQGVLQIQVQELLSPPDVVAWLLHGTDMTFDPINLIGTPVAENVIVYVNDDGPFFDAGIGPAPGGPVAIMAALEQGTRFDLTGLGSPFDDQVTGPFPESFAGIFEVTGPTSFEVRDLLHTFSDSDVSDLNPGTLTITTSGSVVVNLSGSFAPDPAPLPGVALALLAAGLVLVLRAAGRAR